MVSYAIRRQRDTAQRSTRLAARETPRLPAFIKFFNNTCKRPPRLHDSIKASERARGPHPFSRGALLDANESQPASELELDLSPQTLRGSRQQPRCSAERSPLHFLPTFASNLGTTFPPPTAEL